ncbi:MAG: bifunctional oligoribonuclease/PAP phosphatase NrnA [Candidatus Cloacimonetes bacterium]|nr:bifunctional oligoribonuclease/PAP phosphatase NrnA [Candidatus Cloacimonadota bacterium]
MISNLVDLKDIFFSLASKNKTIAIVTHQNPDGDGLPASFALKKILAQRRIYSKVILEEEPPEIYDFLDVKKNCEVLSESMEFELIILVDCHEKKRVGKNSILIEKANGIIAIDHHPAGEVIPCSNTFIDTKIVSAGAIIYRLFAEEIEYFPKDVKNYLGKAFYTTILNDTDNFMNANVDKLTFEICAELMETGITPGNITEKFLLNKSASEMKFIGEVLSTIELHYNGKVMFLNSTLKMLQDNNLSSEATTKLTRWVKGTKGVKVFVYFREIGDNKYRLSLRSNFINVNAIAVKFDGGGHTKASGCEMNGDFAAVKEIILKEIGVQL